MPNPIDKDRLAGSFLFLMIGSLIVIPAGYINWLGHPFYSLTEMIDYYSRLGANSSHYKIIFFDMLKVAVNEEFLKTAFVILFIHFKLAPISSPFDYILYFTSSAIGFATIENLSYSHELGIDTAISRAFTAVPAHYCWTASIAYYYGLVHFHNRKKQFLICGFCLAIMLHSLHNFGCITYVVITIFIDLISFVFIFRILLLTSEEQSAKLINKTALTRTKHKNIRRVPTFLAREQQLDLHSSEEKEWNKIPWPPEEIKMKVEMPKEWLHCPWPPKELLQEQH